MDEAKVYTDENGNVVENLAIDPDMFCACDDCKVKRYNMHDGDNFSAGKYTLELLNDRWHQSLKERIPWRFSIQIPTLSKWLYSISFHQNILRKTIPDGSRVLDLACGIGQLASFFDPRDYLGIDIYKPAIEYCKIYYPRHRFEVADIFERQFGENEFDFIIAGGFDIDAQIFAAIKDWGRNILHFSYSPPTDYTIWNKSTNKTVKGR